MNDLYVISMNLKNKVSILTCVINVNLKHKKLKKLNRKFQVMQKIKFFKFIYKINIILNKKIIGII